MARYDSHIPVNLLTGFLGSGKTTLLQGLLESPQLRDTAVLINEFGEVGLDHLLLQHLDEETVILQSGCLCCTIRDDLSRALRDLFERRERGVVPPFDRVVIETTGLADPAPIVSTLMADPVLCHHFRLGNVVTTVDAVNARRHLAENPESVKQVAVADRLVLTKTDLCDEETADAARGAVRRLNRTAPLFETARGGLDPEVLLTSDLYDPRSKTAEVRRWLREEAQAEAHRHADDHDVSRHDRGIRSFCLTFEQPLDWTVFGLWLTMLLHAHGDKVLRVKGLLNLPELSAPVAIHGVQQVVHPPVHLARWPDEDRRSKLVFIVRDLEPEAVQRSLSAFMRLVGDDEKAA